MVSCHLKTSNRLVSSHELLIPLAFYSPHLALYLLQLLHQLRLLSSLLRFKSFVSVNQSFVHFVESFDIYSVLKRLFHEQSLRLARLRLIEQESTD